MVPPPSPGSPAPASPSSRAPRSPLSPLSPQFSPDNSAPVDLSSKPRQSPGGGKVAGRVRATEPGLSSDPVTRKRRLAANAR